MPRFFGARVRCLGLAHVSAASPLVSGRGSVARGLSSAAGSSGSGTGGASGHARAAFEFKSHSTQASGGGTTGSSWRQYWHSCSQRRAGAAAAGGGASGSAAAVITGGGLLLGVVGAGALHTMAVPARACGQGACGCGHSEPSALELMQTLRELLDAGAARWTLARDLNTSIEGQPGYYSRSWATDWARGFLGTLSFLPSDLVSCRHCPSRQSFPGRGGGTPSSPTGGTTTAVVHSPRKLRNDWPR